MTINANQLFLLTALFATTALAADLPVPHTKPHEIPTPYAKPAFDKDVIVTQATSTPRPIVKPEHQVSRNVGGPLPQPDEDVIVTQATSTPRPIVKPERRVSRNIGGPLPQPIAKPLADPQTVAAVCRQIAGKLHSIGHKECLDFDFDLTQGRSVLGTPIIAKSVPSHLPSKARVLLVGGTHGDEYSSISVVFKWLNLLEQATDREFEWLVVPLLNPDGLLRKTSTRTNANGVDLNRNLPTSNWLSEAREYWVKRTAKNPRRFPGNEPLSEPENRWLVEQIETFSPDVIISAHAPHGVVDFDGPPHGPKALGALGQRLLGVFPGSLGNYAGVGLGIPVVTIEFSSAGAMPTADQIVRMWEDLNTWLQARFGDPAATSHQLRADAGQVSTR